MTSNQFYVPRIERGRGRIFLEGEEHHHLARVARIKEGDTVWLFDGRNVRCLARVETVLKEKTELSLLGIEEGKKDRRLDLTLVQSLMTARKMEFILQKASEFGIAEFVPLETTRSLRISSERSAHKLERWKKIAREAVKQSKGTTTPAVLPPTTLAKVLQSPIESSRFFLSEDGGKSLKAIIREEEEGRRPLFEKVILCVGPEGGWTEEEEKSLLEGGFEGVSLGRRILRTETAALAAVAVFLLFWGG